MKTAAHKVMLEPRMSPMKSLNLHKIDFKEGVLCAFFLQKNMLTVDLKPVNFVAQ